MFKNFSVIIFILAIIYIIFNETRPGQAYYLPSKFALDVYMNFLPPLMASIALDILKRVFKNKIAQRIILTLNILALGYTFFILSIFLILDFNDFLPTPSMLQFPIYC